MSGWHAKLSASSAHRWMPCPGSVRESAKAPAQETNPAALEGTAAHHFAAVYLQAGTDAIDRVGDTAEIEGETWELTEEMADAVQVYLDTVREAADPSSTLVVEKDFTEALQELDPDFGGTADAVLLKPMHVHVFDYKHGSGVWVPVRGNKQLKYYALGVLLTYADHGVEKVSVTIVQPRHHGGDDEGVRTWEFDAIDLLEFAADLKEAAAATRDPDAPLVPGESQCRFCPARVTCPALEEHQTALVAAEFDEVSLPALSPEKLSDALDILPLVEERCKALRQHAYDQAMKGVAIPRYKLVEKRATTRWTDTDQVIQWLNDAVFDLDDYLKPSQPKAISAVKKLLKKEGLELPEDLTNKSSSGYTLAHESDKRAPAQLASPDDFDTLNPETEKP